MAEELKIIITAEDKASPVLTKTKGNLGGLGDVLGKGVKVAAGAALGGVTALAGGLAYLGVQTVQGNAKFEEYNTQFEVLLGSADAAKTRMAALAEFGKVTPFELSQVVEADRILQSFGFHSVEAAQKFGKSGEQIRTIAGDVASGTGASFSEISLLLGKFSSGATGEAIMRFQELGITTREEMSKMGLEFSKSGELLSPLPQAMTTVLQIMEGKYGGLMDKQSKTFSGMMSNLQDWLNGTIREVGRPVFEALSKQLDKLLVFLGSPEMQAAMNTVSNWLAKQIPPAVDLAVKALDLLTVKGGNFQTMIITVKAWVMSGEGQTAIQDIGKSVGNGIADGIRYVLTNGEMWGALFRDIIPTVLAASNEFRTGFVQGITGLDENAARTVGTVGGGPMAWIASLFGKRAGGGPVSAGAGYIVGERGPELFFPGQNGTVVPSLTGGGGLTFVYAPQMSLASESEITNVLTPALDRWYRNAQRRRVVG
jgi:hypothetical protein